MNLTPRVAAVLVALSLAGAACSSTTEGEVAAPSDAPVAENIGDTGHDCAPTDVPLLRLETKNPGEPALAIPQPPGWERYTDMDSQLVRGVIVNPELRVNDFSPNAAVTMEDLTGKVTTVEEAFDAEINGLSQVGVTVDSKEPSTLCGFPSLVLRFAMQGRPATTVIVVGEHDDRIYAATLAVQTSVPDDPRFIRDSQTILSGFQFGFPADS
jgi:hypothetical protein